MTTARQAFANSTYFKKEGLFWLRQAAEARRGKNDVAETLACQRLVKITRQLRLLKKWRTEDEI